MSYTKEERETIITTDDCMENWNIYTRQKKVMTKLLKLDSFTETRRITAEEGHLLELEGTIPFKRISFTNIPKISEEKRKEKSDRMKNYHKETK